MSAQFLRIVGYVVLAFALVLAYLRTAGSPPLVDGTTVRVLAVYDGDTIEVELDGKRERVRYIGIDTPEMDDTRPAIADVARRAYEENRRLVGGRRVELEFDAERTDRYGRLLAYVRVGDTLVNEWLVRQGLADARPYPPNLRHQDRLERAEREAHDDGGRFRDARP